MMAAIPQTTYCTVMQLVCFIHVLLIVLRIEWQIAVIGSGNGIPQNSWLTVAWTSDGLYHWRLYLKLGDIELGDKKYHISPYFK